MLPSLAGSGPASGRDGFARSHSGKLSLGNTHYGYRGIGALLRREGWQVNHRSVLRIRKKICCACALDLCSCDDELQA
ncbi:MULTISPECIES: IS3 family transposase [unclassified Mesorhizobium]|uniref:IS3 family transposase n=1 Tax=unclassified Mesorhizobium TaxID=325217 RepID=UPI003338CC19